MYVQSVANERKIHSLRYTHTHTRLVAHTHMCMHIRPVIDTDTNIISTFSPSNLCLHVSVLFVSPPLSLSLVRSAVIVKQIKYEIFIWMPAHVICLSDCLSYSTSHSLPTSSACYLPEKKKKIFYRYCKQTSLAYSERHSDKEGETATERETVRYK